MTHASSGVKADDTFVDQCVADYRIAEITALAHIAPGPKPPTHLLAVVELLHANLEPNPLIGLDPKRGGYPRRIELGSRGGKLLIQRWHVPVRDGIQWYRSCLNGSMEVPTSNPSRPTNVQLGQLGEDPTWPNLLVEVEAFWPHSEFWGNRPGGSRWHRLLPLAAVDLTNGWQATDFEKARDFFMSEVHVDLLSRSVLLGSCHLRLPNPVFRKIRERVGDDWESVTFDVESHPGQSVDELELTLWNQRSWGATSIQHVMLRPGRNVLHLPEGVQQVAHAVSCKKRGLLKHSESAGFLSAIQTTVGVISEQRRVETPKGSYTVGIIGESELIQTGTERPTGALNRLAADEEQQRKHKAWEATAFRWFDKDSVAGTQAIRDTIQSASKSVDLIDPYFGRSDLLEFSLSTTRHGLPFRVLTSHDFCTSGKDPDLGIERGDALAKTLDSILAQDPKLHIEVKVMRGQKSPVHDRFLIVDGTVWVLGASLNEFGSRGSLLMKLPAAPDHSINGSQAFSVSASVFDVQWSTSDYLNAWVKQRADLRAEVSRPASTFKKRVLLTKSILKEALRRTKEVWDA